jgi:hypothetical protein
MRELSLMPLAPCGAEIDLDLRKPFDASMADAIRQAFAAIGCWYPSACRMQVTDVPTVEEEDLKFSK